MQDAKVRTILSFNSEVTAGADVEQDKTLPNGDPALIEWNPPLPRGQTGRRAAGAVRSGACRRRYRGKVLLLTTAVNMDWSSWPGSPSFTALMQEMTRVAVSGRLREHTTSVSGLLEEFLPAGGGEIDALVHYPEYISGLKPTKVRTQLLDDVNLFRFSETDYSGLYKVVVGSGAQEIPFAVNFPASTAEPARQ